MTYEYRLLIGFLFQALIQREQLAEELNNMKGRFDSHVQNMQQTINEEKESARKECKVVIDEQNKKVRFKDTAGENTPVEVKFGNYL